MTTDDRCNNRATHASAEPDRAAVLADAVGGVQILRVIAKQFQASPRAVITEGPRVELRNPTAGELAAIGQAFQSLEALFALLQNDQTFPAPVPQ